MTSACVPSRAGNMIGVAAEENSGTDVVRTHVKPHLRCLPRHACRGQGGTHRPIQGAMVSLQDAEACVERRDLLFASGAGQSHCSRIPVQRVGISAEGRTIKNLPFTNLLRAYVATWELGVKAPADESQCCEMIVVRSHRASLVGSRV